MPTKLGPDFFSLISVRAQRRAREEDEAKKKKKREADAKAKKRRRRKKPSAKLERATKTSPGEKPKDFREARTELARANAELRRGISDTVEPVSPTARAAASGVGAPGSTRFESGSRADVSKRARILSEQAARNRASDRLGDLTPEQESRASAQRFGSEALAEARGVDPGRVDQGGNFGNKSRGGLPGGLDFPGAGTVDSVLGQLDEFTPGTFTDRSLSPLPREIEAPIEQFVFPELGKFTRSKGLGGFKEGTEEDFNPLMVGVEGMAFMPGIGVVFRTPTAVVKGGFTLARVGPKAVKAGSPRSATAAAGDTVMDTMRTSMPLTRTVFGPLGGVGRKTGGKFYDILGTWSVRHEDSNSEVVKGFTNALKSFQPGERAATRIGHQRTNEERFGFGIGTRLKRLDKNMSDEHLYASSVVAKGQSVDERILFHERAINDLGVSKVEVDGVLLTHQERGLMARIAQNENELEYLRGLKRGAKPEATRSRKAALETEIRKDKKLLSGVRTFAPAKDEPTRVVPRAEEGTTRINPMQAGADEKGLPKITTQAEMLREEQIQFHTGNIKMLESVRHLIRQEAHVRDGVSVMRPAIILDKPKRTIAGLPDIALTGNAKRRRMQEMVDLIRLASTMREQVLLDAKLITDDIVRGRVQAEAELILGRALQEGDNLGAFTANWLDDSLLSQRLRREGIEVNSRGVKTRVGGGQGAWSPPLSVQAPGMSEWTGSALLNGLVDMTAVGQIAGDSLIRGSRLAAHHNALQALARIAKAGKDGQKTPTRVTDIPIQTGKSSIENIRATQDRLESVLGPVSGQGKRKRRAARMETDELDAMADEVVEGLNKHAFGSGVDPKTKLPIDPSDELGKVKSFLLNNKVVDEIEGVVWVSQSQAVKALGAHNIPSLKAAEKTAGAVWAGNIGQAINNSVRAAILYLNPAYAPMNLTGNIVLNFVHQGFLAPMRLAQASRFNWNLDKALIMEMDAMMGEGLTSSVLSSRGKGFADWFLAGARPVQALTDAVPRRAALFHEIARDIARSRGHSGRALTRGQDKVSSKDVVKWLKESDQATKARVATLAKKEIVDFDTLNHIEKTFLAKYIFFYPWLKGSTKFTKDLILDHPFKAGASLYVGNEIREFNKDALRLPDGVDRPEFLEYRVHGAEVNFNPANELFGIGPDLTFGGNLGMQKGDMGFGVNEKGETLDEDGATMPIAVDPRQGVVPIQTLELVNLFRNPSQREAEQFGSRVSPLIQSLIEGLTRRGTFFGEPLSSPVDSLPLPAARMLGALDIALRQPITDAPVVRNLGDVLRRTEVGRKVIDGMGLDPTIRKLSKTREPRTGMQSIIKVFIASLGPRGFNKALIAQKEIKDMEKEERQTIQRAHAGVMVFSVLGQDEAVNYLSLYDDWQTWDLELNNLENEIKTEYQIESFKEDADAKLVYEKGKIQVLFDIWGEKDQDAVDDYKGSLLGVDMTIEVAEGIVEELRDFLFSTEIADFDAYIRDNNGGVGPRD